MRSSDSSVHFQYPLVSLRSSSSCLRLLSLLPVTSLLPFTFKAKIPIISKCNEPKKKTPHILFSNSLLYTRSQCGSKWPSFVPRQTERRGRIWETAGSNPNSNYPKWSVSYIPRRLQVNARILSKIRPRKFNNYSVCYYMLCSVSSLLQINKHTQKYNVDCQYYIPFIVLFYTTPEEKYSKVNIRMRSFNLICP